MEDTKGPTLGNGKICYIGIPAINIAESAAFYSEIFDWEIRKRGNGSVTFNDGIGEVSGTWILGLKPATEPGVMVSIMVDSIQETVDQIIARGCKIIKQMAISEHEMIAWFSDPAGNVLGLYQHPGGGNGKICYLEIPATDITRSANFYEAVFGWPVRSDNHGNAAFDDGVGIVSGMWTTELKPSISGIQIYIMMDSVEETVEAVITNGGKITQPMGMEAPEITARFSDPAGNVLGLYQNPV
jgi:predicted enzyme related to lactoylglutathione lyase